MYSTNEDLEQFPVDEQYSILETAEEQEQILAIERAEELEIELEKDERKRQAKESPEKKKLKRDIRREALARLEDAARTQEDFEQVIAWWDRLDANRERRERGHEIGRSGDALPLESGEAEGGLIFPAQWNGYLSRQIRKGEFLDAIFNCPYEIHELVTEESLSLILRDLSEDHREILFLCAVCQYSTKKIGEIRGQTDRNIRKVRATLLRKIYKKLLPILAERKEKGLPLTTEERRFFEGMENGHGKT